MKGNDRLPERQPARAAELEAWLDGALEEPRAASLEERLAADSGLAREAALARRIQDSLRRSFPVPAVPAAGAEPARPALGPSVRLEAVPSSRAGWWGLVLLAAAAVLLFLARPSTDVTQKGPRPTPERVAVETPSRAPAAEVCVGPLEEYPDGTPLRRVTQPDLETLYMEATRLASDRGLSVCGAGGELAGALADSYGEQVLLRPEVEGRLQGPFASSEWPTGMVLASTSEEAPAVLVAERDSTLACCLAIELPADSHLKVFTWRVGELLLTEITPLTEPRLLDYFAAAY